MDEDEKIKYYIPRNIKRDFTIGPFKALGLVEGVFLGMIVYFITGLFPIKYDTIKTVVQLVLSLGIFILAARGIYTYSLSQYLYIIIRYYYKRDDKEYKNAFRLEEAKKKTTEYKTQGMVIEEAIGNRIVKLKDGRFVGVVQVSARNLFSKSEAERDAEIANFAAELRVMPVRAQIVTYTRSADPYEYINFIKDATVDIKDKSIRKEIEDYIDLCRSSIGFATEEVSFCVVFSTDALDKSAPNIETKMEQLRKCMMDFEAYLSLHGMASKLSTNDKIYAREMQEILFRVYNPMTMVKDNRSHEFREKKVKDTFRLFDENVDINKIPLSYYLAPVVFDDHTSPNYIFADDCYQAFYYIEQDSYPDNGIEAGFLATLPHEPGIDYHMFYERIDDRDFTNKVLFAQNMSRKMINTGENESRLRSELSSVHGSADFLRSCIENGNLPYYVGVIISIRAKQYDRLLAMEERLSKGLYRRGMNLVSCKYLQREAYISTRLGNQVHPKLWKKMKQNVPENTLAAFYPFVETKMNDADPIFLGISETPGAPSTAIMFNQFDTSRHDNGNLVILGSTGKGKTFLCLLMALRMAFLGYQVFIIAPIKGDEYDGLIRVMNGNTVRINSVNSGQTINIMEIYPIVKGNRSQETSLLLNKVDSINAFVRFKMEQMTSVESQILNNAVIETYGRFGITKDNDSIWEDKEKRIKKKMPILKDLVETVEKIAEEDDRARDLLTVLTVFTTGNLSYFNNETNIDLTNKITLFDLSSLSKTTKTISMFAVTELIQSYCEIDNTKRKILLVDEIWMLLENEQSSNVVLEWARTIRGKGGSLISASQQLADMFSVKSGGTLVAQAESKVFLGMNEADLKSTSSAIYLSDEVKDAILNRPRGHGILLTRDDKTPLAILGSGHNMLLFSTDPTIMDVRKMISNHEEQLYVEQLLADGVKASEVKKKFLAKYSKAIAGTEAVVEKPSEPIESEIKEKPRIKPEVRVKPPVRVKPEVKVATNDKPPVRIKPEVRVKPEVRIKPEVRVKPEVRIKPEVKIVPDNNNNKGE